MHASALILMIIGNKRFVIVLFLYCSKWPCEDARILDAYVYDIILLRQHYAPMLANINSDFFFRPTFMTI